jgi:hypothetical protein
MALDSKKVPASPAPQATPPQQTQDSSSLVLEPPKIPRNEIGQAIVDAGATRGKVEVKTAPPPRSPATDAHTKIVEEYLTGNGWEMVARDDYGRGVWRDPLTAGGDRGVRTKVGTLPKRDGGGSEDLFQVVCPPTRWDRSTEEAVSMQRSRDEAVKPTDELTPLERTDRQGEEIKRLLGAQIRAADLLDQLLKRQIPQQPQNLTAELVLVRSNIQAIARRLRNVEPATAAA